MTVRWPDLATCANCIHEIKMALSDHYNGRGPAVCGTNANGQAIRLRRVKREKNLPYGLPWDGDDATWFVLRSAGTDEE